MFILAFEVIEKTRYVLVAVSAIAGRNVGGDLHAMDAGAGGDRGAGAHRSSAYIVGIEYVCCAVGRIRTWTGKSNRISCPAETIAAVQHTIYFGEISWCRASEGIRLSNGAALQSAGARSPGADLQLNVDPVDRATAIQIAFIDDLSGCVRNHTASDRSITRCKPVRR